jgi:hypothetical protein
MARRDSRYQDVKRFAPDPMGRRDFKGLMPRRIVNTPGVLEHVVVSGQRLDGMAQNFYGQDRRWWRIPDANVRFFYGGDLVAAVDNPEVDPFERADMPARVILIPRREEQ